MRNTDADIIGVYIGAQYALNCEQRAVRIISEFLLLRLACPGNVRLGDNVAKRKKYISTKVWGRLT